MINICYSALRDDAVKEAIDSMYHYHYCGASDILDIVEALNSCYYISEPKSTLMVLSKFKLQVKLYDFSFPHCVLAKHHGRPVGVLLVGKRMANGWLAGLGVRPDHRRCGIGETMMKMALDKMAESKVHRIDLEVRANNDPAVNLYLKLGFEVIRPYFSYEAHFEHRKGGKRTRKEQPIASIDQREVIDLFPYFHPAAPCWQRDVVTLERLIGRANLGCVRDGDRIRGYIVSGLSSIYDLGIDPKEDIVEVGEQLLNERFSQTADIRIINVPEEEHSRNLFERKPFRRTLFQYHMRLKAACA